MKNVPPHGSEAHSDLYQIKDYISNTLPFYSDQIISSDSDIVNEIKSLLFLIYQEKLKSKNDIQLIQFKNGITNKLFKASFKSQNNQNDSSVSSSFSSKDCEESEILVRIYGKKSELLINRETELIVSAFYSCLCFQ